MQEIKSYKDLVVWQKAHQLANEIFNLVEGFPKTRGAEIIKTYVKECKCTRYGMQAFSVNFVIVK